MERPNLLNALFLATFLIAASACTKQEAVQPIASTPQSETSTTLNGTQVITDARCEDGTPPTIPDLQH